MSLGSTPAEPPAAAPFVFDGEQVVEGGTPERLWQDCKSRYDFSVPFAVGRRVLDAACGSGYGSAILAARGASSVLGVDINARALNHARATYNRPNLRYTEADVTKLPLDDASIDVVTSFETIEHVDDAVAALAEFGRVLVPSGILVVSTPNRIVTSPGKGRDEQPDNRFHKVEWTEAEFDALLAPGYRILGRYGQRAVPAILYHSLVLRWGRRFGPFAYAPKHGSVTPSPLSAGWAARYLVYVCQRL
jgi:SAM-dependent methyltransferase